MTIRRGRIRLLLLAVVLTGCGGGGGYLEDLQHPSPDKRVAAAEFLGSQREAKAVPQLAAALQDTSGNVRAKAAWALGMIRARETRPELIGLLSDADRRVQQAAIWALTQLEEPEAIPALENALASEKDTWVRTDLEQAIEYLRQFEGDADVDEAGFR